MAIECNLFPFDVPLLCTQNNGRQRQRESNTHYTTQIRLQIENEQFILICFFFRSLPRIHILFKSMKLFFFSSPLTMDKRKNPYVSIIYNMPCTTHETWEWSTLFTWLPNQTQKILPFHHFPFHSYILCVPMCQCAIRSTYTILILYVACGLPMKLSVHDSWFMNEWEIRFAAQLMQGTFEENSKRYQQITNNSNEICMQKFMACVCVCVSLCRWVSDKYVCKNRGSEMQSKLKLRMPMLDWYESLNHIFCCCCFFYFSRIRVNWQKTKIHRSHHCPCSMCIFDGTFSSFLHVIGSWQLTQQTVRKMKNKINGITLHASA